MSATLTAAELSKNVREATNGFGFLLGRSRPIPANETTRDQSDGDDGARTRDLVVANHALSQLSYIPFGGLLAPRLSSLTPWRVGVLGFEPRTSALSELRSSQLSYTPRTQATKKPNPVRFGPIRT